MTVVKWVNRLIDDNNKICGYTLVDEQGKTVDAGLGKIKQLIRQGKLEVINLTLASDNRLIENTCTELQEALQFAYVTRSIIKSIDKNKALTFKSNVNIENRIAKALVAGQKAFNVSNDIGIIESKDSICILSSVQIRLTDTKGEQGLFGGTQFKSIDFSGTDTSSITNMGHMFDWCKAQSLNLSSFDTSSVTNMCNMFDGCRAKSLDILNFDTSRVTDMSAMFRGCDAQSLDLSSFDTANVTDMHSMFSWCKVQSLDLSCFNTAKVTDMSWMFEGCKVQLLDISNLKTANVTNMHGMFSSCNAKVKATDSKIIEQVKRERQC